MSRMNKEESVPLVVEKDQSEVPKKWYDPRGWTRATWIRLAILLLVVAAIIIAIAVFKVQKYLPALLKWLQKLGWKGAIVFVGVYMICTVAFIPGSILTLGAGFIWKLYWGSLIVTIGANLGANLAFILGRTAMRKWVSEKVKGNPKFYAVDQAIKKEGWKLVLLLRLSPILPFNLLNYSLALTDVQYVHYTWATLLGMLPGTALYVYFGSLAQDLADLAANGAGENLTTRIIIWCVSGVFIFLTVIFVTIIAKRAINKSLQEQEGDIQKDSTSP